MENKQAEAINNVQRDNLRTLAHDKNLQAQMDRINDLLTGVELVVAR